MFTLTIVKRRRGVGVEHLAKELVALQPDVILAHTISVAAALQRETRAIPIVFVSVPSRAKGFAVLSSPVRLTGRDLVLTSRPVFRLRQSSASDRLYSILVPRARPTRFRDMGNRIASDRVGWGIAIASDRLHGRSAKGRTTWPVSTSR